MPIKFGADNRVIEISGNEYTHMLQLHEAIEKNQPIEPILAAMSPDYRQAIVNYPHSYLTRDLCNSDNMTSAHIAAEYGRLAMLKLLIAAGADLRIASDNYGVTVLHTAAEHDQADIVDYLLKEQHFIADTPCIERDYYPQDKTPLMKAAVHGCLKAAKILLMAGADPDLQSSDEKPVAFGHAGYVRYTALDYANSYGHGWSGSETVNAMVSLLKSYSAKAKSEKSVVTSPGSHSIFANNDGGKDPETTAANSSSFSFK